MTNVYFLHQIKHNKSTDVWDKGIVVKSTENADNLGAVKQSYHAYLGAYAYGNNADTDYVQCQITNLSGNIIQGYSETWMENTPVDPEDE